MDRVQTNNPSPFKPRRSPPANDRRWTRCCAAPTFPSTISTIRRSSHSRSPTATARPLATAGWRSMATMRSCARSSSSRRGVGAAQGARSSRACSLRLGGAALTRAYLLTTAAEPPISSAGFTKVARAEARAAILRRAKPPASVRRRRRSWSKRSCSRWPPSPAKLGKVARKASRMGCGKPERSLRKICRCARAIQAAAARGPHPIRPSATFPNFVGEGARAGFRGEAPAIDPSRCSSSPAICAVGGGRPKRGGRGSRRLTPPAPASAARTDRFRPAAEPRPDAGARLVGLADEAAEQAPGQPADVVDQREHRRHEDQRQQRRRRSGRRSPRSPSASGSRRRRRGPAPRGTCPPPWRSSS